ncbi:MAG: hypothetical protein QOD77_1212 [Thermoplasmata archaeon]|jgi:plastocyanin|nr:hypothetical protein [Thermoplasmata archaeon]
MRLLLAAATLMLALAGCSSSDTDGSSTMTTSSSSDTGGMMHMAMTHDVSLEGNAFVNQTTMIHVGDKVRWTHNDGTTGHTVTYDDGSYDSHPNCAAPVGVAPVCMADGDVIEQGFAKEGTVAYHCKVHPSMTGTIVVQPHDMMM